MPGNDLIVAVNLDPEGTQETTIRLPLRDMGVDGDRPFEIEDLLTGEHYLWRGAESYVKLDPSGAVGHVLRLVETNDR